MKLNSLKINDSGINPFRQPPKTVSKIDKEMLKINSLAVGEVLFTNSGRMICVDPFSRKKRFVYLPNLNPIIDQLRPDFLEQLKTLQIGKKIFDAYGREYYNNENGTLQCLNPLTATRLLNDDNSIDDNSS